MKFFSSGSSASAARLNASSSRPTTLAKESRKMPDMLHSTSTRGRPGGSSSSRGMSSYRATRPVPSFTARAPTSSSTMPTDSPFVLIASRPQRLTDTVSGNAPSFAARCCANNACAMRLPRSAAAGLGMRYGSSAWMLRPVGNTPGPSRSRSPPAAGGRYSPFRARSAPLSSSVFRRSSSRISNASSSRASDAERARSASESGTATSAASAPGVKDTSSPTGLKPCPRRSTARNEGEERSEATKRATRSSHVPPWLSRPCTRTTRGGRPSFVS
mmetsp:Transcript_10513/g.44746  ORF Transcript_10513/g.44746 Transcript_10513/m.44746 type:complete len:273 (-) Transcript_10513:305-1123(-)